jgi:hypothetical protein
MTSAARRMHLAAVPRTRGDARSFALRRLATRFVLSRWFGATLAPWEREVRRGAILGRLWAVDVHVPAVNTQPWKVLPLERSRRFFALAEAPVSIREHRDVPSDWSRLGPIAQLETIGRRILDVLELGRPEFHRSLVRGRLVEASGTTIAVTALTKGGEVMAVPWSYGEAFRTVGRRMNAIRERWASPLADECWRAVFRNYHRPTLPPPQAVLSVVAGLGIENPETSPMASGGASPLAIVVGARTLSIAWDHRVYDASNAARFYEDFFP